MPFHQLVPVFNGGLILLDFVIGDVQDFLVCTDHFREGLELMVNAIKKRLNALTLVLDLFVLSCLLTGLIVLCELL